MLRQLLGYGVVQTTQMDGSSADHIVLCDIGAGTPAVDVAALVIIEEKGELGNKGDPSVQGSFSYIKHWHEHPRGPGLRFLALSLPPKPLFSALQATYGLVGAVLPTMNA
ncbi:hypothetical protein HYPSUDRAFT_54653 [Hypholoma sublateritium FD-334 SS-4]|uniref:Uncharacterized protein n=1 Tax=Hypholoma sublateritium (strain FD-334 SS-4) TaxID=945553 RepID=A0A0D2P2T5_HYPSF|nr:hypothetical protein HYPSUDRAFT_54653 [Hypholoma sublateritium FD-334 SS-4]